MLLNFLGITAAQGSIQPPTFISAATSTDGATVTITFSKEMADPSGKHAQFIVSVAGSADAVTAAALNADTTKINLTLTTAVTSGQTVTVAYTAGTVTSADTGVLASFTAQSVTNNVAALYQAWSGYPNSPLLTADYPYQFITLISGNVYMMLGTVVMYFRYNGQVGGTTPNVLKMYRISSGNWSYVGTYTNETGVNVGGTLTEANHNVYTDNTYATVYFAKTTP